MKRLRLQKEYQKQIGKIERQIERLKSELENTKTAACEKKKMADSLETRIEHDKKMQQIAKSLFYQSGEVAKLAVEKMKKRIAIGIPYQKRKRQQQINQIIHGLQSSTPRDQAIGLNDCCRFFTEELQLGKTIALWNGPVLIESGRRQKTCLSCSAGSCEPVFCFRGWSDNPPCSQSCWPGMESDRCHPRTTISGHSRHITATPPTRINIRSLHNPAFSPQGCKWRHIFSA